MRKTLFIVVAAFMVVGVAACSTPAEESYAPEPRAFSSAPSAETESVAVPAADPTAPGEVCDPGNANDAICAAFYPETALNHMLQRIANRLPDQSVESLALLASEACAIMSSGATSELLSSPTPETMSNDALNSALFAAAAYGECQNQAASQSEVGGWLIPYYQGIGEDAARAEFADGSMPESMPESLFANRR